jgi:hypothetical protein
MMFEWYKNNCEQDVSEEFLENLIGKEVSYSVWLKKENREFGYETLVIGWSKSALVENGERVQWFSVFTDEGLENKLLKGGKFTVLS